MYTKRLSAFAISEWQDMQQKPNAMLRGLLKNKKTKTCKLSELSQIEQIGWRSLMGCLINLEAEKTGKIVGWVLG